MLSNAVATQSHACSCDALHNFVQTLEICFTSRPVFRSPISLGSLYSSRNRPALKPRFRYSSRVATTATCKRPTVNYYKRLFANFNTGSVHPLGTVQVRMTAQECHGGQLSCVSACYFNHFCRANASLPDFAIQIRFMSRLAVSSVLKPSCTSNRWTQPTR
jgi:hypothetical protein